MNRTFGGTLLVAGTSIGAGMLALPVVTAEGGFIPAFFIYFICWLYMTATGLLFLEVGLKLPPGANLVTMAATYLGKTGKFFAWGLYLFLFYCLSTAYVSGGGLLLQHWLNISIWQSELLFLILFIPWIVVGAKLVDKMNFFLMIGLIVSYFAFIFLGIPHIQTEYLQVVNWNRFIWALPVIFTSFSYQGIVPSLITYLDRDPRKVRFAIIGGTSIAFAIYFVWEWVILGTVPVSGEFGLLRAKELGQTAIEPLKYHLASNQLVTIGNAFAFFAIATSFLGVGLGLFDFWADGLKWEKKGMQKLSLACLTFLPPSVIAFIRPDIFITALVFAGGIGCALLLGLMPTLMAWVSRYKNIGHTGPVQLFGGKGVLFFLIVFVALELLIEFRPIF